MSIFSLFKNTKPKQLPKLVKVECDMSSKILAFHYKDGTIDSYCGDSTRWFHLPEHMIVSTKVSNRLHKLYESLMDYKNLNTEKLGNLRIITKYLDYYDL